jgi:putative membrane protein
MYKSISVFTVLCLLGGCSSNDTTSNNNGQNGTAAVQNNGSSLSVTDRQFMQAAANGGMCEVQAGQLAQQRATNDQLKQFGQQMVSDHTAVNNQLTQLAQQKGVALPTALDADAQSQIDKLNSLSGNDFDDYYVTGQVKAHENTIKLFQDEANNGQDNDVKAFASQNLPTIQHHLDMIHNLQSAIGTGSSPNLNKRGPGMPNDSTVPPNTPSGNGQTMPPQNQNPPGQQQ